MRFTFFKETENEFIPIFVQDNQRHDRNRAYYQGMSARETVRRISNITNETLSNNSEETSEYLTFLSTLYEKSKGFHHIGKQTSERVNPWHYNERENFLANLPDFKITNSDSLYAAFGVLAALEVYSKIDYSLWEHSVCRIARQAMQTLMQKVETYCVEINSTIKQEKENLISKNSTFFDLKQESNNQNNFLKLSFNSSNDGL